MTTKRSGLGGGLWIIPLISLLGSIYSFFRAYRQHESGTAGYNSDGVWVESASKMGYLEIGATWFGIILFAIAIISFWLMKRDR